MDRLEMLLALGKEREGRDRKTYVTLDEIRFLVSKGAHIDCNNRQQVGGSYLQEVVWEGVYWYVTTTEHRVNLSKPSTSQSLS
jgi:hypothetical protein